MSVSPFFVPIVSPNSSDEGIIIKINGTVIDVLFEEGNEPIINDLVEVIFFDQREKIDKKVTFEVIQHLDTELCDVLLWKIHFFFLKGCL